jgi:transposase
VERDELKTTIGKRVPASTPHNAALHISRKMLSSTSYDGQGFWLATKRLSKGRFRWWPQMTGAEEPARVLRAHQAQVLLAAGNPDIDAAPVWRKVS